VRFGLGVMVALALSGCSASGSASISADSAKAVGLAALSFKSSGSTSGATTGWTSTDQCPSNLQAELLADLPAGSTVTPVDAAFVNGPLVDPALTTGDTPSCVFSIHTSGRLIDELYFIGMADTYSSAIVKKLPSDGFVASTPVAVTDGTRQDFVDGVQKIVVSRVTSGTTPIVIVVG
jgi:hypothetical protein